MLIQGTYNLTNCRSITWSLLIPPVPYVQIVNKMAVITCCFFLIYLILLNTSLLFIYTTFFIKDYIVLVYYQVLNRLTWRSRSITVTRLTVALRWWSWNYWIRLLAKLNQDNFLPAIAKLWPVLLLYLNWTLRYSRNLLPWRKSKLRKSD